MSRITLQDVKHEQGRVKNLVSSMSFNSDALLVNDLVKHFKGFVAVRGITFGVHHGECFGLLGINGAGKTTTFRQG